MVIRPIREHTSGQGPLLGADARLKLAHVEARGWEFCDERMHAVLHVQQHWPQACTQTHHHDALAQNLSEVS